MARRAGCRSAWSSRFVGARYRRNRGGRGEPGPHTLEITSSDPHHDSESKRLGYAEAGIEFYLLVDRSRQVTVLYSEPGEHDYDVVMSAPFGKTVVLPAPFNVELDTAEFR